MFVAVSRPEDHNGKFIALEGDSNTISTQLTLLPPSQKVLVLPPLKEELDLEIEAKTSFDARKFIHQVQSTVVRRAEKARAFLRSSTAAHPKLVFMNGGAISARTTCILKIAENVTQGDVSAAEARLDEIMKGGVAGLCVEEIPRNDDQVTQDYRHERGTNYSAGVMKSPSKDAPRIPLAEFSIPSSNFTGTQDQGDDFDAQENVENLRASVEFLPRATFCQDQTQEIVRTVLVVPSRNNPRSSQAPSQDDDIDTPFLSPNTPGTLDSNVDQSILNTIPYSANLDAIFEEALLVDVQSARVERGAKYGSYSSEGASTSNVPSPVPVVPLLNLAGRPSLDKESARSSLEYFAASTPQTAFSKASIVNTQGPSPRHGKFSSSMMAECEKHVYIDRGSDAYDTGVSKMNEAEDAPNMPVFDLVEDYVIHFTGSSGHQDQVFDQVLRSYQNGTYSKPPSSPANTRAGNMRYDLPSSPGTPSSLVDFKKDRPSNTQPTTKARGARRARQRRHSCDPLAVHNPSDGVTSAGSKFSPMTPPLSANVSTKFLVFSSANVKNPISIQNSFRQFLSIHFPAGEKGFSQHYYPVSPAEERMWKPVFNDDEGSPAGAGEGRCIMDQIIALGYEDGVPKEFFTQISGLIERLGTKRNGITRSGHLDIRYLIGNATQTLSGHDQRSFNPLSDPSLLATLLIPQLERFFAANYPTRLLVLHYPHSYLPTMFALRSMIGEDFKIAGILDSLAFELPTISRPHTPVSPGIFKPLSKSRVNSLKGSTHDTEQHTFPRLSFVSAITIVHSGTQHQSGPPRHPQSPQGPKQNSDITSLTKADYLLLSKASDTEILSFISEILKLLILKSDYYTPDLPPEPVPEKTRTSENEVARLSLNPATRLNRLTGHSIEDCKSKKSFAPSIATRKTYASSIASTKRRYAGSIMEDADGWESFIIGEVDSDDDEFDRMIMGRAMARIVPERKIVGAEGVAVSKRKALKWLGLA